MFMLESYITPIILNHVAKYVNIRPEDAQLSLWQGAVTFQNIDLRLDVLEEELNLPIELRTGHIHDLNIHVPWTRIASEPIRITINTIEFVMKLRTENDMGSASVSPKRKPKPDIQKKKITKEEAENQSLLAGLANKIINNITVEFHNIIFKYLDEDIMVSMNVQKLTLSSADDKWKPAMVDVNPVSFMQRKLLQVEDLTICLDNLNSAGQIEVCHEPLLYRCTLECRIYRKYHINTVETTSTTRVAVLTKSLDLNLSSLQFPMIIRVINLILGITNGQIKIKRLYDTTDEEGEATESVETGGGSWAMWAYNLLPNLNFSSYKDATAEDELPGHINDIGVYIDEFNFTLKNSEYIHDTLLSGTKRIQYRPIIRISFGNLYYERQIVEERGWCSIRVGVSSVCVEPLDTFVNGSKICTIVDCNCDPSVFYTDMSLFDKRSELNDKNWALTNYKDYSSRFTDQYLLYRSPIFAFDMIKYQASNTEESKNSLNMTTDIIDAAKNLLQMQYRLLSSGVTFRFNQGWLQVKHLYNDLVSIYDYSAYPADKLENPNVTNVYSHSNTNIKLPPPLMEDFDALMQHVPRKTYKFIVKNLTIEFHAQTDQLYDLVNPTKLPIIHQQPQPQHHQPFISHEDLECLPYFQFNIATLEGFLSSPLHPDNLVHTTCQLPDKPKKLIEACYDIYDFSATDINMKLKHTTDNILVDIMHFSKIDMKYERLIQSHLWSDEDAAIKKLSIQCPQYTLTFTKRELFTSLRLFQHIGSFHPLQLLALIKQSQQKLGADVEPRLQNKFQNVCFNLQGYKEQNTMQCTVHCVLTDLFKHSEQAMYHVLDATPTTFNGMRSWLDIQLQIPITNEFETKADCLQPNYVFAMWLGKFRLSIDKHFLEFLKYRDNRECFFEQNYPNEYELQTKNIQQNSEAVLPPQYNFNTISNNRSSLHTQNNTAKRRGSRLQSYTRRISHPEETVHLSSERDEVVRDAQNCPKTESFKSFSEPAPNPPNHMARLNILKRFIFNIELEPSKLDVSDEIKFTLDYKHTGNYTQFRLPKIAIKSTHAEDIVRGVLSQKIALFHKNVTKINITLELFNFEVVCHELSTSEQIMAPTKMSITVAMEHKEEKLPTKITCRQSSDTESELRQQTFDIVSASVKSKVFPLDKIDDEEIAEREDEFTETAGTKQNFDQTEPSSTFVNKIDNRKNKLLDVVTINLHIDVTHIHFYMRKLKSLHKDLYLLIAILKSLSATHILPTNSNTNPADCLQIITADEENPSIKEFLDLETNSDKSADDTELDKMHQHVKITWFGQCSIAKVTIEVESVNDKYRRKMILDFEDMLSTLDKQLEFTKCTAKIGNFSLNFFHLNGGEKSWLPLEDICMKMLCNGENLPILNVIVTTVGVNQLYKKLGAKNRSCITARPTITEIIVNMQEVDIIMDLDMLKEFLHSSCPLYDLKYFQSDSSKHLQTNIKPLTAGDLPMIHLESMGVTLYLPLQNSTKSCTVSIWKIEYMKITPNLENPLQRNVIRADVFSKAAQMGILGTPGAIVEDRQYELTFKNISAVSGNWQEVLTHMRKQSSNLQHLNPALEWNNQSENSSLQLAKIFANFTFVCIFAPSILYKNILICGQAIEMNCASNFVAQLHTYQINLLSYILLRLKAINSIIKIELKHRSDSKVDEYTSYITNVTTATMNKNFQKSQTSLAPVTADNQSVYMDARESSTSFVTGEDNDIELFAKSDSGYSSKQFKRLQRRQLSYVKQQSHSYSQLGVLQEHKNLKKYLKPERYVPHSMSFIAGVFVINIFDVQHQSIIVDEISCKPLLSFTITEPSYMFKQNINDAITQISLFDLSISIAQHDQVETIDFAEKFLATAPGHRNSSGIPSPLITFKSVSSKQRNSEVDIEITKSLIFTLTENYVKHSFSNLLRIYTALIEDPCFNVRSAQSIRRASKIELMRERCFNADRLHAVCQRIEFKLTDNERFKCRLVCAELNANIKFLLRPEKAGLKASIGTVYLQTDTKICIHPIAVRLAVDFVRETWHRLPLVLASIKFNIVHIDVDVDVLLQLREAAKGIERLSTHLSIEYLKFLSSRPPLIGPTVAAEKLCFVKTPRCKGLSKKINVERDEYYQDDLRAGAFQFVEISTDAVLPLPYQIQIIKKDFGIICWRYPQPRKMFKINIYPVPMAVENPIQIKCRLEHYSELFDRFVHYCDFFLTESNMKEVELPEYDICATIWRVVILQSLVSVNGECFDTSEEDEELHSVQNFNIEQALNTSRSDADFILHPKVLVGCMRVDTTFQSKFVPKVQIMISFNQLQIKLLNLTNQNAELPVLLKPYHLTKSTATNQAFLIIEIEHSDFCAAFYNPQHYTIDSNLTVKLKCLDYGFLNMLPVLEPSKLQFYASINKPKRSITVNLLLDKMRFNIGPSVLQTLLTSKAQWQELLAVSENSQVSRANALLPKCVVVNRTNLYLAFGQTGTNERIELAPQQCHFYYFCSDYHSQELTFVLTDEQTLTKEVSQSVKILFKYDGDTLIQNLRTADKCIVIKLRKLSATQIIVLIKGQIELISMVPHALRVQFRCDGQLNDNQNVQEYFVESQSRASFYQTVQRGTNINLRLRIKGEKGRGRTGDIPLKANKNLPWLVKVPIEPNEFISFWVRVLREDITGNFSAETFEPQKILIIIWPIFEINNLFDRPIQLVESSTNTTYNVPEADGRQFLDLPATHLSEHKIDIDFNNIPVTTNTQANYTLMLKSIDWHKLFKYDEFEWPIEEALYKLAIPVVSKWPMDNAEELRIQRNSTHNVPADVIYKCQLSREFACSISVEIAPWGVFINATGLDISICDYETKRRLPIASNNIEMMFKLSKIFTIDIQRGNSWHTSIPIVYDDLGKNATISKERHIVLQSTVPSDVAIMLGEVTVKCVLTYKIENERKIFKLFPKVIVTNFLPQELCLLPFVLDHKESTSREELSMFDKRVPKFNIKSTVAATATANTRAYIGRTIDAFFDVHAIKAKRTKDTAFVYFVCIKANIDSECSIPLPLAMPFTRRCLSIQNGTESIPLVVTLIEKANILYLNIFRDISPAILIYNLTDISLIVAQSSASENSHVTNTTNEYEGKHFEWFQLIPASSQSYYTPPELANGFPDSDTTMCNLTLAMHHDGATKKTIKWSKPIRTDKAWKKFLHLPSHGDIKILICDKHRVIRMSIYYISQQSEFSVKDLRSRILTLPHTFDINPATITKTATTNVPIHKTTLAQQSQSQTPIECQHFREECEYKLEWKIRCFAKELSLTLHTDNKDCDYIKQEILAINIDDLACASDDNEDERVWNVLFSNIQIDNQLYNLGKYDFPVVLCAQQLYTRTPQTARVHDLNALYQEYLQRNPMMQFRFELYLDELKLNAVTCKLSPLRVYIEDAFVNDFLEALVEYSPMNCVYKPDEPDKRITLAAGESLLPDDVAITALCIAEPLKLRTFSIDPLNVLLSVHTSLRLYLALDHSPLSFSKYERRHVLTMPLRFGQSLGLHYLSGAIFGAGWVVGSLEILGSPSGLARSFTTGLRDFVSMPMQGLFRGPWGFIVGITQGSASLFRNVTAGTVNSVTKLASSVARNLDRLSLDQEHIDRTEALRRLRPQGFAEGLSQGITGFGISLLGAVGGIAHHTLEANNAIEVLAGLSKGIVGVITKPISGAAELVALTGQGMLHTVGFNTMPQQYAPCVAGNIAVEPSAFRIWKLLPGELLSDQVLVYNEVTLVRDGQMKRGYAFLTLAIFAIIEAEWDKLALALPVDKVDIRCDPNEKSLLFVRMIQEPKNDIEENFNYTNQRIMNFLQSSEHPMTSDCLHELLQTRQQNNARNIDWSFYIDSSIGQHLMQYIKIMKTNVKKVADDI